MAEEKKCPLFRQPEILSFTKGSGYCDLDSSSTACEGDVKSFEKPDALKQHFEEK
ncbi:MAG TPA: hypothetical protein VEM15_09795 [Thermodesulfobacteriota bacterium]|nr:hypothetical protein [Thermodesulfobacteriota bacterium]